MTLLAAWGDSRVMGLVRATQRQVKPFVPRLYYSHPNFFFIYAATMLFHVSLFSIGVFGKPPNFASPSLQVVNGFAAPQIWGLASLAIFITMALGLYRTDFRLSRMALAAGAVLAIFRFVLIALPLLEGKTSLGLTALPPWALLAALHLSQTAEPPRNPATATTDDLL